MKILNIGMQFKASFDNAFRKFADTYTFQYEKEIVSHGQLWVNDRLKYIASHFQPDLIWLEFHDWGSITIDTIKHLRTIAPVFIWNGDIFNDGCPEWYNQVCENCDHVFISNERDIKIMQERGYKNLSFLNHYDEALYKPMGLKKEYDVIFIASRYNRFMNSEFREQAIKFLYDTYPGFKLFGDNYLGEYGAEVVSREQGAVLYNKAKMAINISNVSASRYTSDRLMHICGTGTLCLCHRYENCETDLGKDGENVRYFSTLPELKELIDYYSIFVNKGIKIGARGREMVIEKFGDENLKKTILSHF